MKGYEPVLRAGIIGDGFGHVEGGIFAVHLVGPHATFVGQFHARPARADERYLPPPLLSIVSVCARNSVVRFWAAVTCCDDIFFSI